METQPRKVNPLAGEYRPKRNLVIKGAGTDIPAAQRAAGALARDLRQHGFSPSVTDMTEGKTDVTLSITDDLSFGDTGYRLMVGEKITLVAATEDGLLSGTRILTHLLSGGPDVRIRRVRIED